MEKKYYLAYGSNLNISQMMSRCPDAKIIGSGLINDYRLLFKGSRSGFYLTIEPKTGSKVPVAVWEVTAADERRLDIYEGFPDFYYKKNIELPIKNYKTGIACREEAFLYIMHEYRPLGAPSLRYFRTCLEGYIDFGFDTDYLEKAYAESCNVINK